jgi:hypothetical protein
VTEKAEFVAKYSVNCPSGMIVRKLLAEEARLALALDPLVERDVKIHFGEDWVDPLSDVEFIGRRGECAPYEYDSPDVDDNRAHRISLDFANVEPSRNGIAKFFTNWGPPTAGLVTERQFYDMCHQLRCVLLSAAIPRRQEMIFRLHRGYSYEPSNPFECAVRELEALANHGVLRHIRECEGCGQYYIPNKKNS